MHWIRFLFGVGGWLVHLTIPVETKNPYEGLELARNTRNRNILFSQLSAGCPEWKNIHTPYWIDTTYALRNLERTVLQDAGEVVSMVVSMFPQRSFHLPDQYPGEICCVSSCAVEEDLDLPTDNCVSGVVTYKNVIYQLKNILLNYPLVNKVVFLEPNTFGLVASDAHPPWTDDQEKEESYIVEGYVNSLVLALSVLGKLPNTTIYLDGGQSFFTNASVLTHNYQSLFSALPGAKYVWLTSSRGNDVQARYYTYIDAHLNQNLVRGFVVDVRGYPRSIEQSLHYLSSLHEAFPDMHFVVDTGHFVTEDVLSAVLDRGWICNYKDTTNPLPSTSNTSHEHVDAYLWVTTPATSDGVPRNGPTCSLNTSWTVEATPFNTYNPRLLDERCVRES